MKLRFVLKLVKKRGFLMTLLSSNLAPCLAKGSNSTKKIVLKISSFRIIPGGSWATSLGVSGASFTPKLTATPATASSSFGSVTPSSASSIPLAPISSCTESSSRYSEAKLSHAALSSFLPTMFEFLDLFGGMC